MLRLDHVVVAVRDLDAAVGRFRAEFGLDSVAGGRHPGWGTGNRIVPLGEDYVELVSVVDAGEATGSAFGRGVLAALEQGDRPFAVCVETERLDEVAARLGVGVTEGSRARPDGQVLAWRGAGLDDAIRSPFLPFFIEWRLPSRDLYPGRVPVAHALPVRGLAWVEVGGDAARLTEWLGGEDLPIRVVDGPAGVHAFAVATADGEIVVR